MFFSIFYGGCNRTNLSTFLNYATKVTKSIGMCMFFLSLKNISCYFYVVLFVCVCESQSFHVSLQALNIALINKYGKNY